jgi:hypothetical protein
MKQITTALVVGLAIVLGGCTYTEDAPKPVAPKEVAKAEASKTDKKPSLKLEKDAETGLVIAEGFDQVKTNCTIACHSAGLVTQSRGNQKYWKDAIVYMQKNQGLWDLGNDEPIILKYLATHYGEVAAYRRTPLKVKWQ